MVTTRSAMEARIENLERQMGELVQLLQGRNRDRSRGRSRRRRGGEGSEWDSRGGDDSASRARMHNRSDPSLRHGEGSRKMELPLFVGEDAYGWLVRIERYFRVNGIRDEEKLDLTLLALEGKALNWYQGWEEQATHPSWELFKEALLRRFQPGIEKNRYGPVLKIKQTGRVMDYIEEFELVAGPMKEIDKEMMKGIFLNGLKRELQAELKLFEMETLAELKERALLLEERNLAWGQGGIVPGDKGMNQPKAAATPSYRAAPPLKIGGSQKVDPKPTGASIEKKGGFGRRLSQAELEELSRKGLCFKCGEKWGPEHVCKFRHYQLMLVETEEEGETRDKEDDKEEEEPRVEFENPKDLPQQFEGAHL